MELEKFFVEGLVPIDTLPDDRYLYHENTRKIIGERSRREFSIGDQVHVMLDRVDAMERKLQFSISRSGSRAAAQSAARKLVLRMPTDIGDLVSRGEEFAKVLEEAKQRVPPSRWEWYRYDSLANLQHLDQLLTGDYRDLVKLSAGDPVLDFGCADGDLAFFLESLGLKVLTFDHVRTNHNGMMGVRALKEELNSSVEIHELDLDNNFEIPEGRYGLALVLGILYHLKNPFYVLETISKRARYCLLSTRITRLLPDRVTDVSKIPMAYLLGETELNADATNFWIFSEAGLRRIVERANWRVVAFRTIGDTEGSDPVSLDHDERAFCLLESVYGMGHLDCWMAGMCRSRRAGGGPGSDSACGCGE